MNRPVWTLGRFSIAYCTKQGNEVRDYLEVLMRYRGDRTKAEQQLNDVDHADRVAEKPRTTK
jgi:hypothetical protein